MNLYIGLLKLGRFSFGDGGHIEIERIQTSKERDTKDNIFEPIKWKNKW